MVMAMDPDVIFVGEIRDIETLDACVTAAETGHLVITQLHADSPERAIQRMIDVQPEEMRPVFRRALARTLRAVSVQRLIPAAEGKGVHAAYGLLIPDKEMRRAIAEGRDIFDRTAPLPDAFQTLADDVRQLRSDGKITEAAAKEILAQFE